MRKSNYVVGFSGEGQVAYGSDIKSKNIYSTSREHSR